MCRYTQAIQICPDKDTLKLLYSNRSMAHSKSLKYKAAREDAENVIQLAPDWAKGYWRLGSALSGLGDVPGSEEAFYQCWKRDKSNESILMLRKIVNRLSNEQLGVKILELCDHFLEQARIETAEKVELQEGAFKFVSTYSKDNKDGDKREIYSKYLQWRTEGMDLAEGYILRGHIYYKTNCFLQSREDARLGLEMISKVLDKEDPTTTDVSFRNALRTRAVQAYSVYGLACLAQKDHPDRNAKDAIKAFTKALNCGCQDQDVMDYVQEASEDLTMELHEEALQEAKFEGTVFDQSLRKEPSDSKKVAQIWLSFPDGSLKMLTPGVRESLRYLVARIYDGFLRQVTIEKIERGNGLRILLHMALNGTTRPLESLNRILIDVFNVNELEQSALTDDISQLVLKVSCSLGNPDCHDCRVQIIEPTSKTVMSAQGPKSPALVEEKRIIAPLRPKTELSVPYRSYRLVDSMGNAVARPEKHAFCMSRVYYDRSEIQQEVWVETADGSCRWRQSGSEIKVIVLKVPTSCPAKNVEVKFEPYAVRVKNKVTGDVYLDGTLHRGIIPDSSFWTHMGGDGEDGCCLTMTKMNLEVLRKHWMHSEMWWSKLFASHEEIAWDDYEKDYSDLPDEVLQKHKVREAIKDAGREEESMDEKRRNRLQDLEDRRKRKRQDRLNFLRDGNFSTLHDNGV